MTNASTDLARGIVARLVAAGVTDVVVAPGSRNAPVSFAAYAAAEAGRIRLHSRLDERSAAFLALGLTKVGARAAVVCTSGTAVANLHPAVLEAAHAAVGLVVVTADRPARLRGTNANQTTDQVGVFGPLVATQDLATDEIELVANGPTHLNVQLDDPLLPDDDELGWLPDAPPTRERRWPKYGDGTPIRPGPLTVVVAGDDAGPPARVLAERAGWPLFAEPSSGSRTGDSALRCYRLLLDGDLASRIGRVVVYGHPTLSRPITQLLGRPDIEVWAQRAAGMWAERPFDVDVEFDMLACEPGESGWIDEWHAADASVAAQLDALLATEPDLTPYEVAGAVANALPPGGLLVVGASSPIRDLDLMVPRYEVGARRKVIANRGLAGIDGTVSTAIGAALGRSSERTFALMGDVTFLHDAGGLVMGPAETRPDLTIVVVNDDGGSIFAMLEQGDPSYSRAYDRLFGTPHHVDLAALCAATRTPHWRVESLPELEQALASPNGGVEVVEVRVRRDNRRDLDARIRALVPDSPE
ncbi:2-succinyl-5-enolpyruvyl-6-hydroxy-3-cyclohexene-1-carboxylic-acid synthase [Nocardioides sp. InS609-2]|uniref:2-succinyl-5-enolpyruvyl-6-hydroxy-3- cyclohexene-1-carboxylic-acid synthase n=1 Tax=Nocardioides sp. InS609-2 TaxID=2760705 RepID=UPI0020C0E21D|nr:2-succinyl-5-enolpyruvyl-6-hydroxy-3-cyclohexene-1-carboxylic-acid synthase [Nocardioides sp. InS609-2]